MSARRLIWIVALAVAGIVVAVSNMRRDSGVRQQAEQVRAHALELIQQQPWYAKHAKRLDPILGPAEETAFTIAYSPGTRRDAPTLDQRKYIDTLFAPLLSYSSTSGDREFNFAVRDLQLKIQQAIERQAEW